MSTRLPPLRGLRCFCLAADNLSFKSTAQQLFITPSAVSHQIKQLEDDLGLALFIRKTRALELTPAGQSFYQAIQPVMQQMVRTISEFSQADSTKEVTISMPEFFASELFLPRLKGWSTQYPAINLRLDTVKTRSDPTRQTDVSIVLSSSEPQAEQCHELFPISYQPACNPSLYEQCASSELEALNQFPLLLHQSRPHAWHQWAEFAGFNHFRPKQILQLDSMFGMARAAEQGLGIALIPMPISQSWFHSGALVALFTERWTTRDRYYLVQHRRQPERPEIQWLIDWVLHSFEQYR
ncbi:LysR substrate-binding domain-containing protein [Alkalimonas collagenimarina]|uniref:LysR substrate-binding domain-containing protein n=1 Tax=Alkalimonas collagenimarina TaxID=400390 RepID=A0ABT9GXC6_9GAMM|nr:LysR substrate-binding domain-containing protein [Alkalimonas collagenimarina]MDP4535692.1 LysR substrate-binding domain-containing protein [Alkalimonas collagenimarina]